MDPKNLPDDLPVPTDDGACDHLLGLSLPNMELISHQGNSVAISRFEGWRVLYFYPMTGRPNVALPDGWNEIPGARGCTPQSCSFRDHHQDLKSWGADVYGISTQSSEYQAEAANRLHLPFELLSDAKLELTQALQLPLLEVDGMKLIKRITLIAKNGRIEKVFYPVFPPDQNANEVIQWLSNKKS